MSKTLFIADWHYWHENIIKYENRPFLDAREMNFQLIRFWNQAVESDDTVYILGDMFYKSKDRPAYVMKRLNGRKILIVGNHDDLGDEEYRNCFDEIHQYLETEIDGYKLVLFHYPIISFKNELHGVIHLYGHVHDGYEWSLIMNYAKRIKEITGKEIKMWNVGASMPYINYQPRTINEIINGVKRMDEVSKMLQN